MSSRPHIAHGAVFYAEPEDFIGGRDPLGIENTSVACYTALLPGLTNLTSHIRYYSIYAWLIDEYNRRYPQGNDAPILQNDFLRRSELLIAVAMNGRGIGAVIGSDFVEAGKISYKAGLVDLAEGADYSVVKKKEKRLYWSYILGAFGQYYLGSLVNMGIAEMPAGSDGKRAYTRRKDLHDAFIKSTTGEARELFIQSVISGTFDTQHSDLIAADFGPHTIRKGSAEWELLNTLLMREDDSQILPRRTTVEFLLRHLDEGGTTTDFPAKMFGRLGADSPPVVVGWSYYYLMECLHYAAEALLWFFLDMLNEHTALPVAGYAPLLAADAGLDSEAEVLAAQSIADLMSQLEKCVKKGNSRPAVKLALDLIAAVQAIVDRQGIRSLLEDFELQAGLSALPGALISYSRRCAKIDGESYTSFFARVISRVLNDHSATAARKMRTRSGASLLKFEIDDGLFRWVQTRLPQYTSPRLRSLKNFLVDLKYIDGDTITLPHDV